MGCVMCNITNCEEFVQGPKPAIKNPFYCKTEGDLRQFLEDLAHDIASQHPEMVNKINGYVRMLDEKAVPRNSRVKDVFWCTPGGPSISNMNLSIGLVVCEDEFTGQRRGYMGIGSGQDWKADIQRIKDWGSPVNLAFAEQIVDSLKEKPQQEVKKNGLNAQ